MNKLSFFLYFADVLNSLNIIFGLTSAAFIIGTIIWWFCCLCSRNEYNREENYIRYPSKWMYVGALFFAFMSCIFPSKDTMYLIAGSEAAQTVATSETGTKILSGINKAIDNYTKKINEEKK